MKKIIVVILMLFTALSSDAQGLINSIFRQKAMAKKYSLEQLVLLRTYKGYINKGYTIAKKGLGDIGGFTSGEYSLHGAYIESLKKVSPLVKKYPRVPEIITMQLKTLQVYTASCKQIGTTDVYSSDEMNYIKGVFEHMLRDCNQLIDELSDLTTNGKLEMKDDERLQHIDNLYNNMVGMLNNSEKFSMEVRQLGYLKKAGLATSATVSNLYH